MRELGENVFKRLQRLLMRSICSTTRYEKKFAKQMVWSVALYESETWSTTKNKYQNTAGVRDVDMEKNGVSQLE